MKRLKTFCFSNLAVHFRSICEDGDTCNAHTYIPLHITLSHWVSHACRGQRQRENATQSAHPSFSSSPPRLSLFIYCLQLFHRTHIDAEKAGCESVSESFPDEGDKVEVISRALMQFDSPSNRWHTVKSRREKKKEISSEGSGRFAREMFGWKVDL